MDLQTREPGDNSGEACLAHTSTQASRRGANERGQHREATGAQNMTRSGPRRDLDADEPYGGALNANSDDGEEKLERADTGAKRTLWAALDITAHGQSTY